LSEIVWLIENNLDFKKADDVLFNDRVKFFDKHLNETPLGESAEPRVIKSHLPLQICPEAYRQSSKVKILSIRSLCKNFTRFLIYLPMF
jgi:hypothetical protein